jgi:hypothetical protein
MLSFGEKKYLSVACVVPIDRFNVFDVQPTGKPDTDFDDSRRTVDLLLYGLCQIVHDCCRCL